MLAHMRGSYIICYQHNKEAPGAGLAHGRPKDEGETEHGGSRKELSHDTRGTHRSLL